MIISIDHGNKQMKTPHHGFVSGLQRSDVRPALCDEYMLYKDQYYMLSQGRLAYRRDKSQDEDYFVLTLFAMAREILDAGEYSALDTIPACRRPITVHSIKSLKPISGAASSSSSIRICRSLSKSIR